MKKRVLTAALTLSATLALTASLSSCDSSTTNDGGNIFHIYCWNDEFKGFFNKYVSDEKSNADPTATHHLDGVEVKWTKVTSDGSQYQTSLDTALQNNANAKEADKVDMFLAEADYIIKYADSDLTKDVKKIGVTDMSNAYQYTIDAASDSNGVVKGASFQCCPAGLIYRRSIAEEVLGTDDPAAVQEYVSDWTKFDDVAKKCKEKGYYVTASYADTYRVFQSNATSAWVDSSLNVKMPTEVENWMNQADEYVKKGYTLTAGLWDAEKTAQFTSTGKAFCTFGPAWYYNFSMGTAMGSGSSSKAPDGSSSADATNTWGDWAVVKGPQSHFWGGTWMLAAEDGSNDTLVAKVMNAFLNDKDLCKKLVKDEGQFSNNKKANQEVSDEYEAAKSGNLFLGGQNDTKIWVSMADSIQFKYNTIYNQNCNEGLQTAYEKYLKGTMTKDKALADFYAELKKAYPTLKTPA